MVVGDTWISKEIQCRDSFRQIWELSGTLRCFLMVIE